MGPIWNSKLDNDYLARTKIDKWDWLQSLIQNIPLCQHSCHSVWPKMAKSTWILHKNDTSKVGKVYTDYFVNFQLLKSLRKDRPSPSRTSGAWVSSFTSFLQDNFRSRATRQKRQSRTSSTSGSSLSGCTRRWRWRPPGCSCGSSSVHHGKTFILETKCKENLLDFYPLRVFTLWY